MSMSVHPRELGSHLAAGEAREKVLAELGELGEWRARLVHGVLPGSCRPAVEDGLEAVGCWLGADVHARKVLVEEVADERGLARRVRADEQHHRLRVKVVVRQQRVAKLARHVLLLDWADLVAVNRFDAVDDAVEAGGVKFRTAAAEGHFSSIEAEGLGFVRCYFTSVGW